MTTVEALFTDEAQKSASDCGLMGAACQPHPHLV